MNQFDSRKRSAIAKNTPGYRMQHEARALLSDPCANEWKNVSSDEPTLRTIQATRGIFDNGQGLQNPRVPATFSTHTVLPIRIVQFWNLKFKPGVFLVTQFIEVDDSHVMQVHHFKRRFWIDGIYWMRATSKPGQKFFETVDCNRFMTNSSSKIAESFSGGGFEICNGDADFFDQQLGSRCQDTIGTRGNSDWPRRILKVDRQGA